MNNFPFNYDELQNKDSLDAYINERVPVGDFLTAIICNDLKEACGRADSNNLRMIPVYVSYLYNEAPASCWGSKEKMLVWLNHEPAGH